MGDRTNQKTNKSLLLISRKLSGRKFATKHKENLSKVKRKMFLMRAKQNGHKQ